MFSIYLFKKLLSTDDKICLVPNSSFPDFFQFMPIVRLQTRAVSLTLQSAFVLIDSIFGYSAGFY
jgi:hypothetical protein